MNNRMQALSDCGVILHATPNTRMLATGKPVIHREPISNPLDGLTSEQIHIMNSARFNTKPRTPTFDEKLADPTKPSFSRDEVIARIRDIEFEDGYVHFHLPQDEEYLQACIKQVNEERRDELLWQ